MVRTQLRTGGDHFEATADYRTDDFAKPGEQFLGTTPFGLRNAVITLGGPLFSKLRYFIAGQHHSLRDQSVRFLEPFRFDSLKTDPTGSRPPGQPLPGPIAFERNYVPNNFYQENTAQGTLAYDLNEALRFHFTGSLADIQTPADAAWPFALQNIFKRRDAHQKTRTSLAQLQMSHTLNAKTKYNIAFLSSDRSFRQVDETFGEDWMLYADSLANARAGYGDFISRFEGPLSYRTIVAFSLAHPNAPLNSFSKNDQSSFGGWFNFSSQITAQWRLQAGAQMESWTMRKYEINNIASALTYLYGRDGNTPREFQSEHQRSVSLARAGFVNHVGYDVDGNLLDSGPDGPRHPALLSMYIQNTWERGPVRAQLGLRYERIASDIVTPNDIYEPAYDPFLFYIDESQLTTSAPNDYFLPRLNLSYARGRSSFFLGFGQYVQTSPLEDLYTGNRILSQAMLGLGSQTVGFLAEPERATHFEFGAQQQIKPNLRITGAFFGRKVQI